MKNLLKPLFAFAIVATTFTSCMEKNDTDNDAYYLKQEETMDSILTAQKTQIEARLDDIFEGTPTQDSITHTYTFLNKTVKRGIYYEVLSEPTDDTYEYKVNSTGTQLVWPKVKIKYTAALVTTGEVVQSDLTGSDYTFSNPNTNVMNNSWVYAFFPYSIRFNGNDLKVYGLTEDGLKKGSKFRMVTPSAWAFGPTAKDKIPANSPLVYEFEVLAIE